MDPAVLALALVAGAVAAFNPCGFALLPAYLGLLVTQGSEGAPEGQVAAVARAVRFAAGMTVGFVAVFGLVGGVLAPVVGSIERYLPVVTVVLGVVLVGVGGWLLAGRQLAIPGLAGHGRAPTASWWSQLGYGVSFALASLSCTIAPFLAVTAASVRTGGAWAVLAALLVYAVGMGTVVLGLAVAVATASTSVVATMRRAGALLTRLSGALLLVAGSYVAWYGWFELRVLAGTTTSDPVISAAIAVQSTITRWLVELGPGALIGIGAALAAALLAVAVARRARSRRAVAAVGSEPSR